MRALREPGRILDANEVVRYCFNGKLTARWVRENVKAGRFKLGGRVFWEENTVKAWIANKVEAA